ncbi:MAG: YbaB/EbfC family nucleoid-associated protein [Myxococcota bacterium]
MFDPSKLPQMLQQAQQMAQKLQAEMAQKTAEGQAGGGMVSATVNGQGELVKLKIDPKALEFKDITMLEDLVTAAVNQAHARVREIMGAEMQKLTGGLPPGLF